MITQEVPKWLELWRNMPNCACCDNGVSQCNSYQPCRVCKYTIDYVLSHMIDKQKVEEAFDMLEQKGHGGGNWRRLVIQTRQALNIRKEE